jgi:hypothetical protein
MFILGYIQERSLIVANIQGVGRHSATRAVLLVIGGHIQGNGHTSVRIHDVRSRLHGGHY